MNKAIRIFFILKGVMSLSFAQDIHFSQFNNSPLNLNPAQTGLFNGDWRFVGNMRNQWSSVPVPYRTFSLSTDTRWKNEILQGIPAVGLLINTDKSGDSKLTTTNVLLPIDYIKKLNKDSTHFISLGIQPGMTTKSFNPSNLSFDNQYDGDAYNPALASGENFSSYRITYLDIGGGIAYLYKMNNRKMVNVGISLQHLTRPKQKFFSDGTDRLDIKTAFSGMSEFPVSEQLDLVPSFIYQHQGKYNETMVGSFAKYILTPVDGMTSAISLGAFYRLKDAFIIAATMDYRNFNVGMSYDINTSKLYAATNHRGGFEISVIYIFKKVIPFVAKKRVCPIYM
ncbi:MAG: PorP/SprF family type IX secretion system membrane protein [Bacteroidota bacterium]